jgi:peptidyl-prolyl cis-trans isomerase SurA
MTLKRTAVYLVLATILVEARPIAGQTSATGAPAPQASVVVQKILVKVNGEVFTQTELVELQIEVLRQRNRKVEKPADLQDDATLIPLLTELTPEILVKTVDEMLIVQYGREQGFKMTDEQFKSAVDRIKKENKLDDEGFKKALAEMGMTQAKLREQLERQQIVYWVESSEVGSKMNLTDAELRQYYQAHPEEFMTQATVTLREVFVAVPAQGDQQLINVALDKAASDRINDARDRALKGEDYLKIVAEVSESGNKENGGLIPGIVVRELNPAIRSLIEKIKVGEVTESLRTAAGYHIFKLESQSAAELEPFDKVRDAISQRIYEERLGIERKKLAVRLREQALIEWKDEQARLLYEKGLAAVKTP